MSSKHARQKFRPREETGAEALTAHWAVTPRTGSVLGWTGSVLGWTGSVLGWCESRQRQPAGVCVRICAVLLQSQTAWGSRRFGSSRFISLSAFPRPSLGVSPRSASEAERAETLLRKAEDAKCAFLSDGRSA